MAIPLGCTWQTSKFARHCQTIDKHCTRRQTSASCRPFPKPVKYFLGGKPHLQRFIQWIAGREGAALGLIALDFYLHTMATSRNLHLNDSNCRRIIPKIRPTSIISVEIQKIGCSKWNMMEPCIKFWCAVRSIQLLHCTCWNRLTGAFLILLGGRT